ncbi:hypothetical protein OG589_24490 [Sphaerisporangium sp. NBC_01403]|uniref:hypothetical protein n=1 Tax=Sphaerisporangium sp. NBC_01403 TaxID=2903599 RepID=UPI0032530F40
MLDTRSQEELIAAELERRARKQAARSGSSAADPVMEGWAQLGIQATDTVIAIRQSLTSLLQDSTQAERDDHDVISRAVTEIPDPALPTALKSTLASLDPIQLITHLQRLVEVGIPWMSGRGIRMVELLAATRPQYGTVRPLDSVALEGDIHWRLYLAVLGHPSQLGHEEVLPIISQLPLPIVDDLIDLGVIGLDDEPWGYRQERYESNYLRARVAPASISRSAAEQLDWKECVARHAFLSGEVVTGDELLEKLSSLYNGATDQLFELRASLPPAQRDLLNEILEGARVGWWPEHVTADRGLWRLLTEQWAASVRDDDERRGSMASRGSRAVNATHSDFHAWRAYCTAYGWILAGEIDQAKKQARTLKEVSDVSSPLKVEIYNLLAYLAPESAEHKYENLETAESFLTAVYSQHPDVEGNLALIRDRRQISRNNRDSWENPYFALGLPHGDPTWNERWRELSRDHRDDIEKLSALNDAWNRLQNAERFGARFFALPLNPEILDFPVGRSLALLPPLQPLLRRTTTDQNDLKFLKALASSDLLAEFDDHLIHKGIR